MSSGRSLAIPTSLASATLKLLLILSIASVAFDEFNISTGFFSIKIALILFMVSLIPLATTRAFVDRRALLIVGVTTCLLFSAIGRLADFGDFFNDIDIDYTVVSRTASLLILLAWSFCLISVLSSREIRRGYWMLFGLLILKSFYILWLFLQGNLDAIFWLPSGEPRFALNRGGMTPNQTGAIWLTVFLFFLHRANTDRNFSRGKASLVLGISIALGIMSGSRSFVMGVFLASFFWLSMRYRLLGAVTALSFAAVSTVAYLLVFPDRGVDESALGRFDKWSHSLENIGNNPFLGSGVGSDSAPHNTVLQVLSESGFTGLAALSILVASFLVWRGRLLTTSVFSFVIPYLFFLLVDIGLLQWQTWLLLATAVVLGREQVDTGRNLKSGATSFARANYTTGHETEFETAQT